MGSGREEEPVLEERRELPDDARQGRVHGVFGAGGGRGVVRLVEDEEGRLPVLGAEVIIRGDPVPEERGVRLVAEESVRDDEARVCGERVRGPAPFAPAGERIRPVVHHEPQAEPLQQLVPPLEDDGRRTGHHDASHLLPEHELPEHEAGLDRLSEPHVVGHEEACIRQRQGLAERLELVRPHLDPGAVRGLEESRIGGSDAPPLERVQVGGEACSRIEAPLARRGPRRAGEDLGVELSFPEDLQRFALCVVIEAGEPDARIVLGHGRRSDVLDEVPARACADDLAGRRETCELQHGAAHSTGESPGTQGPRGGTGRILRPGLSCGGRVLDDVVDGAQ